MKQWKLLAVASLAISMSACSLLSQNAEEEVSTTAVVTNESAESLLKKGRANSASGDYEVAIENFEALEARYPLGKFAEQAMLESAYAYYKLDEPDTALDTLDRFSKMYPRSSRTDYSLYLRGLVNFNRGGSLLDRVFPRSLSDLDAVRKKEAFHDFQKLLTRHANSQYAPDAAKRMGYLRNVLGESEINVAKHYIRKDAYLAAYNRAEYTIKHHQGTPAILDALKIKVCAARELKREKLADDTMRILTLNFPKETAFNCKF